MNVTLKPLVIASLTAMVTVACSAADTYDLFNPGDPLCQLGSETAYWLCFGLLSWSLICMLAILRKLEVGLIIKLLWLGLGLLPFIILQFVMGF